MKATAAYTVGTEVVDIDTGIVCIITNVDTDDCEKAEYWITSKDGQFKYWVFEDEIRRYNKETEDEQANT